MSMRMQCYTRVHYMPRALVAAFCSVRFLAETQPMLAVRPEARRSVNARHASEAQGIHPPPSGAQGIHPAGPAERSAGRSPGRREERRAFSRPRADAVPIPLLGYAAGVTAPRVERKAFTRPK